MTRAIVCGGRGFHDRAYVFGALDALHAVRRFDLIATGAAEGADRLAEMWAVQCHVRYVLFPIQPGESGPQHNRRMQREFAHDLVVAFPGHDGTTHMVSISWAQRTPVIQVGW